MKNGRNHNLSSVKDDEPLCPLLVHDSVAAFSAPDCVTRSNFILRVAFATNVDHGLLGRCDCRCHGSCH